MIESVGKVFKLVGHYDDLSREQKDDLDWDKRVIRELIESVCRPSNTGRTA